MLRRLPYFALMIAAVVANASTSFAGDPLSPHQRLDFYLDESGREQPIRTAEDWAKRREQILAGFQQVAGPLPKWDPTAPFDLQVIQETVQDGVPRQTISVASRNGERITAFLYVPKGIPAGERRAAILALQPTGMEGKEIVAGLGQRFNRGYGLELAQRGYIVICPDYVSFGDQANHDFAKDDYESGTMKGVVDHMRCVDYLRSRPDVDGERIGVIGHSLGGHNSIFLAVCDPRVKAIVSSCGWDPFHHYYGGKKLANWAQERYMPKVVSAYGANPDAVPFDFYELVAALAPRAFLSLSPRGDKNFEFKGVKKGIAEARRIYELLQAPLKLQARYPDCAHDFPSPQRREAYAFLDAALGHRPTAIVPAHEFGTRTKVQIKSTLDGTQQPSYVIVPSAYDAAKPAPLLVSLHSWSSDLNLPAPELEEAANQKGWLVVTPNFRGPNHAPEACGSKLARQDILDAVEWMCAQYNVDRKRIYLTGSSGGGHMTMQMVGTHPEVWAAASAWVGISDLKAWHDLHSGDRYGSMMRRCCGGAPGDRSNSNWPAVDAEYRDRSPVTHLAGAKDVPLEIAAGIYDGHHGSVPVRHSLAAFNVVARANGDAPIDEPTIVRLSDKHWWTNVPTVDAEPVDAAYDRTIYYRNTSRKCRVTLFEGGHERLDSAALSWLESHTKK